MMETLRKRLLTREALSSVLIVLCILAAVVVGLLSACDPRVFVPPAPITRTPTLTHTPTAWTISPTITQVVSPTASATPTPTNTLSPSETPTATFAPLPPSDTPSPSPSATVGLITTPGRNGTMPTLPTSGQARGAATYSGALWTILGVTLLAVGMILFDAASKDNATW